MKRAVFLGSQTSEILIHSLSQSFKATDSWQEPSETSKSRQTNDLASLVTMSRDSLTLEFQKKKTKKKTTWSASSHYFAFFIVDGSKNDCFSELEIRLDSYWRWVPNKPIFHKFLLSKIIVKIW